MEQSQNSKPSIEEHLKNKLAKKFDDKDFTLIQDLFKKLDDTNQFYDLRLGYIGYSHALYSLYGHHYSEKFLRSNVDDLNSFLFDPGKHGSYKYKSYLTTEFRPGYHFTFCMRLSIRSELNRIKKEFDELFFKSKLRNKFILQSRAENDCVEIQLIKMCKSFTFNIDNPLLRNMEKAVDTINGALTILYYLKKHGKVTIGTILPFTINENSLSSDEINIRIKELLNEKDNLYTRINNMKK